jgi:hypothetical protein
VCESIREDRVDCIGGDTRIEHVHLMKLKLAFQRFVETIPTYSFVEIHIGMPQIVRCCIVFQIQA